MTLHRKYKWIKIKIYNWKNVLYFCFDWHTSKNWKHYPLFSYFLEENYCKNLILLILVWFIKGLVEDVFTLSAFSYRSFIDCFFGNYSFVFGSFPLEYVQNHDFALRHFLKDRNNFKQRHNHSPFLYQHPCSLKLLIHPKPQPKVRL